MLEKIKSLIEAGKKRSAQSRALALTLGQALTQKALAITKRAFSFFFKRAFGWIVAILWILLVGFIILRPDLALKVDRHFLGTAGRWQSLTGSAADPASILRNLGWLLITAIGLPLVMWRTFVAAKQAKTGIQQIKLARQGQSADRYVNAAAMLSDEKMAVREAGIFALRQLAISDPDEYYFPVQDLLCSFMRDAGKSDREAVMKVAAAPFYMQAADTTQEPEIIACASDVVSALRAFSDLRTKNNLEREKRRKWKPDLNGSNFNLLPGHSRHIRLQGANLYRAQIKRARLEEAQLQGAFLFEAQLQGADLTQAQLQGAFLVEAQLQGADLTQAQLKGANLSEAQLKGALLEEAQLKDVKIWMAKLKGADLRKARFERKQLCLAIDLADTKFSPPVWPREDWPIGLQPSNIQQDEWGKEFFTFISIAKTKRRET